MNFLEATVDDRVPGDRCLEEREIEDLVRGKLNSEAGRRCEAHLLWCPSCQDRVEEEAEFAQATHDAASLLQQQAAEDAKKGKSPASGPRRLTETLRKLFSVPLSLRWAAVAVSTGVFIAIVGLLPLHHSAGGEEISLRSERGSSVPAVVENAASANVRLRIDVSDVAPARVFQVSVVDEMGRTVETRSARATAGSVSVALQKKLPPGRCWVRLSAADGRLLREYALRVRP